MPDLAGWRRIDYVEDVCYMAKNRPNFHMFGPIIKKAVDDLVHIYFYCHRRLLKEKKAGGIESTLIGQAIYLYGKTFDEPTILQIIFLARCLISI